MRISDWSSDVCSSDLSLKRGDPIQLIAHRLEPMDISAGSAGFASSDLQHGRVGAHRKNLAFRLASLERDRQGARAATDIDDPIARLRCDKLQQEIGRASWRERVCQYV